MREQTKRLLIAGIPLYVALFMIAGRDANAVFLPNFIEKIAGVMWGLTYFLLFIAAFIPIDFLLTTGAIRCPENSDGWCEVTPRTLVVISLILSTIIYSLLAKIGQRKRLHNKVQLKRTMFSS